MVFWMLINRYKKGKLLKKGKIKTFIVQINTP
jgi:hypothetical protein